MCNSASQMRKCAVELPGRNSVSPSTTPRKIDSKYSYIAVELLKGYIVTWLQWGGRCIYSLFMTDPSPLLTIYLQRLGSPFTGSDTHRFFHLGYKDFAIADFSRFRRAQNGFHRSLRAIVRNYDLEFRFRKEIHRVLGAAINFTVPFLTAKSFYLTQSHSFYACRHQCFFHRLCLK